MKTNLLRAIFKCWTKKRNPYLDSIIEDYTKTAGKPCIDGDVTIWTTRPASPPINELLAFKDTLPLAESEILDHLQTNVTNLTWFNNSCEGWAKANPDGKTDTSCVVVGNVLVKINFEKNIRYSQLKTLTQTNP